MPITFQNVASTIGNSALSGRGFSNASDSFNASIDGLQQILQFRQQDNQRAIDIADQEATAQFRDILARAGSREDIDALQPQLSTVRDRLSLDGRDAVFSSENDRLAAIREQTLAQQGFDDQQFDRNLGIINRPRQQFLDSLQHENTTEQAIRTQQQPLINQIVALRQAGDHQRANALEAANPDLLDQASLISGNTEAELLQLQRETALAQAQQSRIEGADTNVLSASRDVAANRDATFNSPAGITTVRDSLAGFGESTQNAIMEDISRTVAADPSLANLPLEEIIKAATSVANSSFAPFDAFGSRRGKIKESLEASIKNPDVITLMKSNQVAREAANQKLFNLRQYQNTLTIPNSSGRAPIDDLAPGVPDQIQQDIEHVEQEAAAGTIPELSAIDKQREKETKEIQAGTRKSFSDEVNRDRIRRDAELINGITTAITDFGKRGAAVAGDILTSGPRAAAATSNLLLRGTNALGITDDAIIPDRGALTSSLFPGLSEINNRILDRNNRPPISQEELEREAAKAAFRERLLSQIPR